MTKSSLVAAAIMVAGVSTLAGAGVPPGSPSPVYDGGPMSPRASVTNLSAQERAAYALLEGVLQSVEAKIHATGCTPVTLPLEVYSDAFASPVRGDAKLGVGPNSLVLNAAAAAIPTYQGQEIEVLQFGAGYVNGTAVDGYDGKFIFNSANNMMVGSMNTVTAMSVNWAPVTFTGSVIKDFYKGLTTADAHIVYDWGLQSLSKGGFPSAKYWQRSKVRRSDGGNGQTAFVKDRLVGVTKCRITIALEGLNELSVFWQTGTLEISQTAPGDPVPEFTAIPDI